MSGLFYRWHRRLAWAAGIAVILWGLSGLLHPLMSWLGPRAQRFSVPADQIDLKGAQTPAALAGKLQASALRYFSLNGEVYLLAINDHSGQRLVWNARTGSPASAAERAYAAHLARLYIGAPQAPVRRITLQTAFDMAYTPVNRLLPVWRVEFDRPDGLRAYISTEDDRLSALIDNRRAALLGIFMTVHKLAFLETLGPLRVTVVALMVGSAALMGISGGYMLWRGRRLKIKRAGARRWHRALGWGMVVTVTLFAGTGLLHLAIRTALPPKPDADRPVFALADIAALPQAAKLRDLRIVRRPDGQTLWRVETPAPPHPSQAGTAAPATPANLIHHGGAMGSATLGRYANPMHGAWLEISDAEIAKSFMDNMDIVRFTPKFSTEYGFANKRLPVWRLASADDPRLYFVDLKTSRIAAQVAPVTVAEQWSFTRLHKYELLNPLGRPLRDGLLLLSVLLSASMAGLGFALKLKRRGRR